MQKNQCFIKEANYICFNSTLEEDMRVDLKYTYQYSGR